MFNGFSDETIRFFIDLKFHNNSTFFHENHQRYLDTVQAPFYSLIEELAPEMKKTDPFMEIRPNKCLAHIHRDTRFTKDKSPYRDHLWFLFRRQAEPREKALNFFFEFGPDTIGWGMGFWGENREAMNIFRKKMISDQDSINNIVDKIENIKQMRLEGSVHKRIDIPPNINGHLERWYRIKEMYICRTDPPYNHAFSELIADDILKDYSILTPLYQTLRGYCDELINKGE